MTKSEVREVKMAQQALAMGDRAMAARILANIYRAGSKKTQGEIFELAQLLGICGQSSFII